MSSVIYYSTYAWKNVIYLLNKLTTKIKTMFYRKGENENIEMLF